MFSPSRPYPGVFRTICEIHRRYDSSVRAVHYQGLNTMVCWFWLMYSEQVRDPWFKDSTATSLRWSIPTCFIYDLWNRKEWWIEGANVLFSCLTFATFTPAINMNSSKIHLLFPQSSTECCSISSFSTSWYFKIGTDINLITFPSTFNKPLKKIGRTQDYVPVV